MAAALRRLAAGVMRKPRPQLPLPPSIYPTMLEKVEGFKKAGAPTTEDTSKVLGELEDNLKDFHRIWEANQRQVLGLLRYRVGCRAFITLTTIGSADALVKGAHLAYNFTIF